MPDLKISQLTDQQIPSAAISVCPIVNESGANRKVTIQNLVKAGISAGNVGLASVATNGSIGSLTDVSTNTIQAGDALIFNSGAWRNSPPSDLTLDGGNF